QGGTRGVARHGCAGEADPEADRRRERVHPEERHRLPCALATRLSGQSERMGNGEMKALEGIRVIDFTQAMAAPFGTMNLADMGADVIKIEPPVTGEPTRELSSIAQNGHSATFMTMNRDKRGLTVDLKQPEGVE